MEDIDLTRSRQFSKKVLKGLTIEKKGESLNVKGAEKNLKILGGSLFNFKTNFKIKINSIFEPWGVREEKLNSLFFSEPLLTKRCDRCGKTLYPWDIYSLCKPCTETFKEFKLF